MKIGSFTVIVAAVVVFLLLLGSSNSRAQMSERCEIAPGTNYVYVPPEVTVYSDRSRLTIYLSTNRESLFTFKSLNELGGNFLLELFADGMPLWVVAPRSDLWRYRFLTGRALVQAVADHRLKDIMLRSNTTQETLQCAVAERREQARLLFEKGYEKMRSDAPEDAERLFLEGLRLDSENADAIFYWGHARILTGNPFAKGSYEAFREALKMGLPENLAKMASAHVRYLERNRPCYKEWYETLPNMHHGSCEYLDTKRLFAPDP